MQQLLYVCLSVYLCVSVVCLHLHVCLSVCCSPREFIDSVAHIRVLSWLLIGSLTHTAVTKAAAVTVCQPLDLEASSYIADHIMVILTGFAEQSKVWTIA